MLADALRLFWVKGLNAISGKADFKFLDIINQKKCYVVYNQIQLDEFTLSITDSESILRSLACDINRFGCASIESINDIHYKNKFPHSHAWKCIKSYYAAYYAAHSILRMMGISCTNFENTDLNNVEKIADAYGQKNGVNISKGYYRCEVDIDNDRIICKKISLSGRMGSHEQLWSVFLKQLILIIDSISKLPTSTESQFVIVKLYELMDNLTYMGYNGGNWLSSVRNDINYKQLDGLWFPYKDIDKYLSSMESTVNKWTSDPMAIDISSHIGKSYLRFLSTSIFIVSISRVLTIEMANRCPKGPSFHEIGSLSLMRLMKQ